MGLSLLSMKCLEGFQICTNWQVSGKRPVKQNLDGPWMYPHSEEVLEAVRMKSVAHYMEVQ